MSTKIEVSGQKNSSGKTIEGKQESGVSYGYICFLNFCIFRKQSKRVGTP
jgi:hypothetical protein